MVFNMIYRITLLLICSLLFSCSDGNESLSGYWVNPEDDFIAEFTDSKVIFTRLNGYNKQFVGSYEKIDDSRFHLKDIDPSISPILLVNWDAKTFSLSATSGKKADLLFVRAPNVTQNEILGTWYSHTKNGSYESSAIITQKDSSYDYDYIDIDHEKKTYSKSVELDIKYTFKNGFIFIETDPEYGEDDIYYLTSYSTNMMNFTGYGVQWSQQRVTDPKHIVIPKDYSEIK